ncbi:MAG: GNAT family N-acetyltransferase [Clostridiales bacterium]|nr:GNAT family N-acetyltransferase [Clostridiales bacterium]
MEVAYKEGWNPGLYDGVSFYQVDPDGFFLAELDGGMSGGISAVTYGEGLAVVGNQFVLPPYRGRGIGKALWSHAMGLAGDRDVRINGLTEGKSFYEAYGFRSVSNVIRYKGSIFYESRRSENVCSAHDVDFRDLLAFDRAIFGVPRERFITTWLETPAMESLCLVVDGEIRGWGCMRRCRRGWRLGPVFALAYEYAEALLRRFAVKTIAEDVYMDIPECNVQAIRLAFSMGMTPTSARLRMYRGDAFPEPMDLIYGVSTLDIG